MALKLRNGHHKINITENNLHINISLIQRNVETIMLNLFNSQFYALHILKIKRSIHNEPLYL